MLENNCYIFDTNHVMYSFEHCQTPCLSAKRYNDVVLLVWRYEMVLKHLTAWHSRMSLF